MAKRAGWLVILACVGGLARPAAAGPIVIVSSRTAIELEPVRRLGPDTIGIYGKLVDKYSRAPIDYEQIAISVDGVRQGDQTDRDGKFDATFYAIGPGVHHLLIEYLGKDESYSATTYEISNFDILKRPLSVSIELDRDVVPYSDPQLQISLTARSDGTTTPALLGPFVVKVGDDSGDGKQVASLTTDGSGKATLNLRGALLGAPGRKRIEVAFAGNDQWDPARAELGFLLRTATAMTFALADADVAHESKVRGSGRLVDDIAGGVAGATIELVKLDQPAAGQTKPSSPEARTSLAKTTTDGSGNFSLSFDASELGPGRFNLQASYDSNEEWRGSSQKVVTVDIAQPSPAPVSYTLLVFGATLLAVLAFILLRTRPWEKIKWRRKQTPPAEEDEDRPAEEEVRAGLQLARPSVMSTLRRVRDTGFAGAVANAVNGRPVGGATLLLRHESAGNQAVDSDGAGRFEIEGLAPGAWQVSVAAYGFCTERFIITIPHRGELRGARVDLLPVRERIFAMYGECAKPMLPETKLWGIWTPRQIFDHVRRQAEAPKLAGLTDFVEEAYFSQRTPGEEAVAETRDLIAQAHAERTARSSSQASDRV
jgi:hypothetical protein